MIFAKKIIFMVTSYSTITLIHNNRSWFRRTKTRNFHVSWAITCKICVTDAYQNAMIRKKIPNIFSAIHRRNLPFPPTKDCQIRKNLTLHKRLNHYDDTALTLGQRKIMCPCCANFAQNTIILEFVWVCV